MDIKSRIANKIKAGFGILSIDTPEEIRTLAMLKDIARELDVFPYVWSITRGMVMLNDGTTNQIDDPNEFIKQAANSQNDGIFIFLDPNPFFEDPVLIRSIKDHLSAFESARTLIFVGVHNKIPEDLKHLVTPIDIPLPNKNDLMQVLQDISESVDGDISVEDDVIDKAIEALSGLTTNQAANALSESIVETGSINPEVISREKCKQLSSKDYLRVETRIPSIEEVGGLDNLKEWLSKRVKMFSKAARDDHCPMPKGLLMVGVPGCGKSLVSKCTSGILGLPLIKFNIGALFGGIVGESESNTRDAIQIAEAMAPCVCWIDELDKQLSPQGGSADNSHETSKRVMSDLLHWFEERSSPVFIVATANNIQGLANSYPELLRKGRFDEIFFVDLPNIKERSKIFEIHIMKQYCKQEDFNIELLAKNTEGYSGVEIEYLCRDAKINAFDEDKTMNSSHIITAISKMIPQSESAKQSIDSLKDWAKGRARNASKMIAKSNKRKIKT